MKEILFWTSHKQYSSDLAEVIRLFLQTRTSRLPTNARTRGLDTICVLNRAVGGILPSAAEWFPKMFFPYNPMIFDSEKTTEKIRQTVRIRLLAAV